MKKLTFLTIILISAGLFTGCKKDDATTVSPVYSSAIDYDYNSAIIYHLALQRPSGDPMTGGNPLMNWDNGYMHISGLIFNVVYAGGPIQDDKFGTQLDVTKQAFDPGIVGVLKVPTIQPSLASFTIEASPTGTQHALMLDGVYYNTPGMPINPPPHVQFIVDEQISINTPWLRNITSTKNSTAFMTLDLGPLANGIDRTMMDNAVVTNGVILISSTSNQNIYSMMIRNLRTMMMPVQFLAPSTGTTTADPAIM